MVGIFKIITPYSDKYFNLINAKSNQIRIQVNLDSDFTQHLRLQRLLKAKYLLKSDLQQMNQEVNEKLIAIVQKKLSSEENILSIIPTIFYFPVKNPNNKKIEDSLIITTTNLYFIQSSQIKKKHPIKQISYITLAILGQEIIIQCDKEWIRIESSEIINIIGNILLAKERFLNEKGSFTIHLEIEKTLENFTEADYHKKSIFSIFKKNDKKMLTASGRRTSFCTIDVNQKNFILEIGRKCYKAIFQNAQLLHISGNATGFRFDAQNYEYRDLSKDDTLYWKEDEQGKRKQYLRRKISKDSLLETEIIRRNLSSYKLNDYNEDIIFALELDTHFEVITEVFDNWIYCWQYLIHHNNYERSLTSGKETLPQESLLRETELKSIFYKLHTFIEEESQKNIILNSLSLDHIYISNGDARISTVFCKIMSKVNVSYIAPEQFKSLQKRISKISEINLSKTFSANQNPKGSFQESNHIQSYRKTEHQSKTIEGQFFSSLQIYKVNLWKLGMLLYELAYHKLPFPIEYVAYKVKHHEHIKVHFPDRDSHSIEFHHFLKSLICKDPIVRGMRTKGDVRMSILNPQITNIMSHEWITKGKK